jgi:hypothetical protein
MFHQTLVFSICQNQVVQGQGPTILHSEEPALSCLTLRAINGLPACINGTATAPDGDIAATANGDFLVCCPCCFW